MVGLTLATLSALGLLATKLEPTPPGESGVPAPASSHAATAGTATALAMTDWPPPDSTSPQALAHYASALADFRNGAFLPLGNLEKATFADPRLGAAHVRSAAWTLYVDPEMAGWHLERARALRGTMSERDQALVDALGPCLVDGSVTTAPCAEAFHALEDRFSDDAEIQFTAGLALGGIDGDAALRAMERAVELDPGFAGAWAMVGMYRAYAGLDPGSALVQCIAQAPRPTACLCIRFSVHEARGDCQGALSDARWWVTIAGADGQYGYAALASALAATGAPVAAVADALRHKAARRYYQAGTLDVEPTDRVALLLLDGDFEGAIRLTTEMDPKRTGVEAEGAGAIDSEFAARVQIESWLELGDYPRAARRARELDKGWKSWRADKLIDDSGIADDPTPVLLLAARRAGAIDVAELRKRRDRWIDAGRKRLPPYWAQSLWPLGPARLVESEADAHEALAALGTAGKIPHYMPDSLGAAYVGRVYQLAGRDLEALPYLEKGAASCYALDLPIEHTRAHLWLGEALEKLGHRGRACSAFTYVVNRWGGRASRSRTLAQARVRLAALGCADRPSP